jgi:hypothetical protein
MEPFVPDELAPAAITTDPPLEAEVEAPPDISTFPAVPLDAAPPIIITPSFKTMEPPSFPVELVPADNVIVPLDPDPPVEAPVEIKIFPDEPKLDLPV